MTRTLGGAGGDAEEVCLPELGGGGPACSHGLVPREPNRDPPLSSLHHVQLGDSCIHLVLQDPKICSVHLGRLVHAVHMRDPDKHHTTASQRSFLSDYSHFQKQ